MELCGQGVKEEEEEEEPSNSFHHRIPHAFMVKGLVWTCPFTFMNSMLDYSTHSQ